MASINVWFVGARFFSASVSGARGCGAAILDLHAICLCFGVFRGWHDSAGLMVGFVGMAGLVGLITGDKMGGLDE